MLIYSCSHTDDFSIDRTLLDAQQSASNFVAHLIQESIGRSPSTDVDRALSSGIVMEHRPTNVVWHRGGLSRRHHSGEGKILRC